MLEENAGPSNSTMSCRQRISGFICWINVNILRRTEFAESACMAELSKLRTFHPIIRNDDSLLTDDDGGILIASVDPMFWNPHRNKIKRYIAILFLLKNQTTISKITQIAR